MHEKAPIALADILKSGEDGTPVRCVLVEGAPGIGKSTLAWEVCHKWEELDSVKQYELVVLIRLREKRAQEAHCLGDLLPCDTTTNMEELLAAIGRGKGMLLVCDGFDELPRKQRHEGSVYIDLLKGRLLAEANIIVTSRPSVSADLWKLCKHNIDRHLEIIGFAEEDIKRFAESVFSGDILAGFLSYITSNPPVYGMMYIPLNAVIVALIYQDSYNTDTPFPATMTELFDALTRALIRRHLVSTHQVPSEYCMPHSLHCTEDIERLPPLVARQLLQLATVAYVSLRKEKIVFTDLDEDFEHLGMMKKTTSLNVSTGPECSYSFLHLTLEEYLAALYIAIVDIMSVFDILDKFPEYVSVLRFLAGMDKNNRCPKVKAILLLLLEHCRPIDLVRCAYECPSIMDSKKVQKFNNKYYVKLLTPNFDWYVTGYCISHFDKDWGLSLVAACNKCPELEIDLLLKGLRSSPCAKGKIQYLHVPMMPFSQTVTPLRGFCQLKALELCHVNIYHDDEAIVKQLIAPGSELKFLRYTLLEIGECTDSFITLLFQPSSLENLILDVDKKISAELLPHSNTNLKVLTSRLVPQVNSLTELYVPFPQPNDLLALTDIIRSNHTLEMVRLGTLYDPYPTTSVLELVEAAASRSQLKELILDQPIYSRIPPRICELHNHLLKSWSSFDELIEQPLF